MGQLLFYPVTGADFETGSYKQFADGPWLTRPAMKWFWDQYLPDHDMRNDPTASPLLASSEQLNGLPRALIITAENDVLRDEGEAYGRKLICGRSRSGHNPIQCHHSRFCDAKCPR